MIEEEEIQNLERQLKECEQIANNLKLLNANNVFRERIKQLEAELLKWKRLLCIAHDYLRKHWDMSTVPLREIDEVVRAELAKGME